MDKTMKKSIIVISAILSTSIPGPASAQYYETYCVNDAWRNAVYRCSSGGCNTKQTYANIIRQLYPSLYSDPYRVLFSQGACEGKQNKGSFEKMKKEVQKEVRRELGIAEPKPKKPSTPTPLALECKGPGYSYNVDNNSQTWYKSWRDWRCDKGQTARYVCGHWTKWDTGVYTPTSKGQVENTYCNPQPKP